MADENGYCLGGAVAEEPNPQSSRVQPTSASLAAHLAILVGDLTECPRCAGTSQREDVG